MSAEVGEGAAQRSFVIATVCTLAVTTRTSKGALTSCDIKPPQFLNKFKT